MGQTIEGIGHFTKEAELRHRIARGLRAALFVFLCALLIFGPLALGVVQPWSTALFEIAAALLLLPWMGWQLAAGEVKIRWNPLFAPALVFCGLVTAQIVFHRTAYLYDSLSELWLYIAYGSLLFIAAQIFQPDYILRFGKLFAVFGAVYAVFAVLQSFTSANKIYWLIQPHAGTVYGTYVNHNHFAGLMELLFPFALVLAAGRVVPGPKRILLLFSAILMAASVFLCLSRGGMFGVVVETAFLAAFWMRQFSPRKSAALFVAFCLTTALLLAWVAPHEVGSRITDTHDPARWLIHRDSVRMFMAHPFLGSGFGTFPDAFPRYRTFYDSFFINHAHDDYLELILETGLTGFAIAVWFIVVLYRAGLRNLRRAKDSPSALVSTAALAGCTGLLAHSFVDFNLHLPANAALFYVCCAIATAGANSRHERF